MYYNAKKSYSKYINIYYYFICLLQTVNCYKSVIMVSMYIYPILI